MSGESFVSSLVIRAEFQGNMLGGVELNRRMGFKHQFTSMYSYIMADYSPRNSVNFFLQCFLYVRLFTVFPRGVEGSISNIIVMLVCSIFYLSELLP